jgi:NAD(P)-dependent dehydrogenase (short-subunit alcohol dehydrogenase family)
VSKRADIERMLAQCAQALGGGLDVLINNAGISGPTAWVENMDPTSGKVMQVDLTGFNVTRLPIRHGKKSQTGRYHQHVLL